jgi:hypothetical protein
METNYRLEFNEKQQQFHMDTGSHEANTFGWVTIAEKCTDLEHVVFIRIIGAVFGNEKLNKKKCDRCYNAMLETVKYLVKKIKNPTNQ